MLTITLPRLKHSPESEEVKLDFEHSLFSLSKWEEIHEKPFFGREGMSHDETLSYVRQMLLTENPPEDFHKRLTNEHLELLMAYVNSKHTATTFNEEPGGSTSNEIVTNELIYHWMIQFKIPWDAQHWHLNRLMTLIKICGIKQSKPKPMSQQARAEQFRRLNEQRRKQLGSNG